MDLKRFCMENNIPPEKLGDLGEVSDGFHTFNSLYHQRLILFATLVNAFPTLAWKSHKHHDGEVPFGGGWFVVGINTPAGQFTYHYEEKAWNLFRCPEVETAPEWDGHTDKDVERLLELIPNPEEDGLSGWAAKEVDRAIATEKASSKGWGEWYYGAACYESAMRAFQSLLRDDHDGLSIQITKSILNRLIDGKTLTPIEDTPDIWNEFYKDEKAGVTEYQCKRMSSLFKKVTADGEVTFSDISRVQCINVGSPDVAFTNGFATRLIDKIFPITMPYLPTDKKFKLFTEEFLVDPKNGDYDTVAYLYIQMPDGKTVELNRYFKEENGQMVKIEKAEFEERKAKLANKKEN